MYKKMKKIYVTLFSILLMSCTNDKSENSGVTIQLVDTQCNPISNTKVLIKKYYNPILPMSTGNRKLIETKTNGKGYFSFKNDARSYDFSLAKSYGSNDRSQVIRSIERNSFGYVYKNKESRTINENNQLNLTSIDYPLFLYKRSKLPEGVRQTYDYSLFKIGFSSYSAHFKPKSIGYSPGRIVELGWSIKDGTPSYEITALHDGEIIDITKKMYLLNVEIPDDYFKKSIHKNIDSENIKRIFYIKNKYSKSIFSINLVYNPEKTEAYVNTLFNNIHVDIYTYRKNPNLINTTTIPQEYCGGALSRWHNGYYGLLDKEKIEYLQARDFVDNY